MQEVTRRRLAVPPACIGRRSKDTVAPLGKEALHMAGAVCWRRRKGCIEAHATEPGSHTEEPLQRWREDKQNLGDSNAGRWGSRLR